jgi:hypothetical protein
MVSNTITKVHNSTGAGIYIIPATITHCLLCAYINIQDPKFIKKLLLRWAYLFMVQTQRSGGTVSGIEKSLKMQNSGLNIICIQVIHHSEISIRSIWSFKLIMCFILEVVARQKCFVEEFIYTWVSCIKECNASLVSISTDHTRLSNLVSDLSNTAHCYS